MERQKRMQSRNVLPFMVLFWCTSGCTGSEKSTPNQPQDRLTDQGVPADAMLTQMCLAEPGTVPEFLQQLGCIEDFHVLASTPVDGSIPGARSVKTVIDRFDENALYFQNSEQYPIHWEFASAHLSGRGLPVVPMLSSFNTTEYSSPSRRFVLGALTHYEGPDIYCLELSPYDAADAHMISAAYREIAAATWLGSRLYFHPTSKRLEDVAATFGDEIPIITTDQLFDGIDYQPLNVAESYGRLVFVTAAELETTFLSFRDIAVLDEVPNDVSVLMGIITGAFQTPLSHINVLSRNRGTPNMALRNAFENESLRALEGRWVRLRVSLSEYEIEAVTQAEANTWWEANKPGEVQVPGANLEQRTLMDIEDIVDISTDDIHEGIKAGTRAYGGKAAHYSVLAQIEGVPSPKAFAIPIAYFFDFMEQHGFTDQVRAMLADPEFTGSPAVRDARLQALRDAMETAPLDPAFEAAVIAKLRAEYPGIRMRFRSSTNAEDLEGFTGAGLYRSKSGDPDDPDDSIAEAIRKVWASVWFFRAFEERSYRSIDHLGVGMALLVHRSFPDEEANGVALTNNPFDPQGLEPAFYVNVQQGEASVVLPPPGVTTDEFLYFYDRPDQPITYLSRSSLVPEGGTVLDSSQVSALGDALNRVRNFFAPIYGQRDGVASRWWAMDVEFKFDGEPGMTPTLFIKQARPFQ
jgi:pyruvate,water dikinase